MKEPIRIVRVIARLNVGGPAVHTTLLTEQLQSLGYNTFLVTGREGRGEGNYLALHGRSVDNLTVLPSLTPEIRGSQDLVALAQLYRLVRRIRPHIVHTHTAKAGLLGRVAARCAGVPVIVHTFHGHILDGYFSALKTRVILATERVLARFTDRIISVSDAVRRELLAKRIGRPERHTVVPLGLDLEPFLAVSGYRGILRAELGLAPGDLLVGIVARLVPIKRHEVFLQAVKRIAERIPNCHFLVVGDGERRSELEDLVWHLGLGKRVRFLGWRADLPEIYADLDVVVLSSRNEGLPVSLIEAMAAGRPVAATRVGGVADLMEDGMTCLLVPPGESGALAEAIMALLGDPERRRVMGEAGRKRVGAAFGADRLVRDMDQLYASLLEEKLGFSH